MLLKHLLGILDILLLGLLLAHTLLPVPGVPLGFPLLQNINVRGPDPDPLLKVPKCEIFDSPDFHYFYIIKPFWVDDFVVKILTYYFNFLGSQASFSFWYAS
jgi:hypothetical protein